MISINPIGATLALIFLVCFAAFGGYFILKHIDEIDHVKQSKTKK